MKINCSQPNLSVRLSLIEIKQASQGRIGSVPIHFIVRLLESSLQIPGLVETRVGENLSSNGQGYTFVGYMRFDRRSSLERYRIHPAHDALLR